MCYFIQQSVAITFANRVNLLSYYYAPSLLIIEMKQRSSLPKFTVTELLASVLYSCLIWSLKSVGIFPKQYSLLSTLLLLVQLFL